MRILLLHPPVDYFLPLCFRSESLGLGYLASVLRRDGHEVEIFDAILRQLTPKQTVREVLSKDFDVLGITASHAHKKVFAYIVREVRKRRKDVVIAAGGYLPTLAADKLLPVCPGLDFIVMGEGEQVASDVFGRVSRNEDWHDAPGVAYLKGKDVVMNQAPPLIEDLDSLPFPARDELPNAKVQGAPGIIASRGCFRRCSFCCVWNFYAVSGKHPARFRSPKNVVDEIESLVSSMGTKHFRFSDDDFIGPGEKARERVIALIDELKSRKLDITFSMECRADEVDAEILAMLKDAGLSELFLGIESSVQRQLDTYNKHITVEQNRKAIDIVRASGIRFRAGFIMFDPYMTVDELSQNLQFLSETKLAEETINVFKLPFLTKLSLFHGVPLVDKVREDGLLIEKGLELDYRYQDPAVRFIMKIMSGVAVCSEFRKSVLRFLGRE